jgi:hypothetical protein
MPECCLFGRIFKIEKGCKTLCRPADKGRHHAAGAHDLLGQAKNGWTAGLALSSIFKLSRIYVDCDHLVTRSEIHGGTACGGNAENSASGLENILFDGAVLVHPAEQNQTRPAALIKPAIGPCGIANL